MRDDTIVDGSFSEPNQHRVSVHVECARQHACNKKKKRSEQHNSHEGPTTKRTRLNLQSGLWRCTCSTCPWSSLVYVVHCLFGVLVDASARRGTRSCIHFCLPPLQCRLWSMNHMRVIAKGWALQRARACGRTVHNNSSAGGSPGELAASPVAVCSSLSTLLDEPATRVDASLFVAPAGISKKSSVGPPLLVEVNSLTLKLLWTRKQPLDCQVKGN